MNDSVARALGWARVPYPEDGPFKGEERWVHTERDREVDDYDRSYDCERLYDVDDLLAWLDDHPDVGRHRYAFRRSWIPEGVGWEVDWERDPDNAPMPAFIRMTLLEALEDMVVFVAAVKAR